MNYIKDNFVTVGYAVVAAYGMYVYYTTEQRSELLLGFLMAVVLLALANLAATHLEHEYRDQIILAAYVLGMTMFIYGFYHAIDPPSSVTLREIASWGSLNDIPEYQYYEL